MIVFNSTHKGASHYKSGKPCQDASFSYQAEDGSLSVVIVCDGHGGDTYVRSDRGSKLAAQITFETVKEFVTNKDASLFIGKAGKVTARPREENSFFGTSSVQTKKEDKDLSDSERELRAQNELFYQQVKDIKEQDNYFLYLFSCIYERWLSAIENDIAQEPFTPEEQGALGRAAHVKAYGSTLIAFVRTELYWFAFQIGDGKCLVCDHNLEWDEPIPWDCHCFLNMTTSLCNSDPIPSFRYAFDGTGRFPAAVIIGSDGLDDSWVTKEKLQNFYAKIVSLFVEIGYDSTLSELDSYLPRLSEKGSRDDMSVAGMVDIESIRKGIRIHELRNEARKLEAEKQQRLKELKQLCDENDNLVLKLNQLRNQIESKIQELESFWQKMINRKTEQEDSIKQLQSEENTQQNEIEDSTHKLEDFEKLVKEENLETDAKIKEIEEQRERLKVENDEVVKKALQKWEEACNQYTSRKREEIEEKRKLDSQHMQDNSAQWMEELGKAGENNPDDELLNGEENDKPQE